MDKLPVIADMVREAEKHLDNGSKERQAAIEYYQGDVSDVPVELNRSSLTTREVRSSIRKVLPSMMRTILGSDEVVEFLPMAQGDEEGAEQSSDYINYVVLQESGARDAVYDALFDALLQRNGILKWWFDERTCVSFSEHTGLTEDAFAQLVESDEIEVLEHTANEQMIEAEGQQMPVALHDVKIRRTTVDRQVKAGSTPRERFLIHPDAVRLEDSPLVGERTQLSRSDLVSMGYDRDQVDTFVVSGETEDGETDSRKDREDTTEAERANELIDYYDLYVRVDMDDDGIAELRHMTFAGGLAEKNLLENDECDEVQYCDIAVLRQPHQWEGVSVFDDARDIQKANTVLLRQTMDNLYWQNNLQPTVQEGAIANMDAVNAPEFGKPIRVKQGFDARTAVHFNQVPFVARESFGMMEYMKDELSDRTGVSDASAGLAPDALQNMTATASAMIEQAGIGQTEMMVRTASEGLRRFFRGLLRLCIRHQDVPRTVRLRDEWVNVDPRQWNAAMDCNVNTGLGAGTRERDMAMMMQVIGLQEKMIAGFGPDNPFVKPENLSNTLSKLVESAGLKTPSLYFATPDPEQIKAEMEARKGQPTPEQMKMQANMELEQAKMQAQMQLEQAKLAADKEKTQMQAMAARDKEKAQMEADLQVKLAESNAKTREQAEKLQSEASLQAERLQFDRYKFDAEIALKREDAARRRQDEIWKAQAANFNPQAWP